MCPSPLARAAYGPSWTTVPALSASGKPCSRADRGGTHFWASKRAWSRGRAPTAAVAEAASPCFSACGNGLAGVQGVDGTRCWRRGLAVANVQRTFVSLGKCTFLLHTGTPTALLASGSRSYLNITRAAVRTAVRASSTCTRRYRANRRAICPIQPRTTPPDGREGR